MVRGGANGMEAVELGPRLRRRVGRYCRRVGPIKVGTPILVDRGNAVFAIREVGVVLGRIGGGCELGVGGFSYRSLEGAFNERICGVGDSGTRLTLMGLVRLFGRDSITVAGECLKLERRRVLRACSYLDFWWLECKARLLGSSFVMI